MNCDLDKHQGNPLFLLPSSLLAENKHKKVTERDLIIFLEFYFVVAKENIYKILSNISLVKSCLNFWLNFALNFKDKTFVDLILTYADTEKTDLIKKNLKEILLCLGLFLRENLASQENYSNLLKQNVFEILEMFLRFYELYENINCSQLSYIIDRELSDSISKCFNNFSAFSEIELSCLREAFYGKIGYAFLDFKGNFLWADKYTKEVLFEQSGIEKLNLFDKMTDFSKFIIRNKYGSKFFDFKDEQCRIREFTYSIVLQGNQELLEKDNYLSVMFETLNLTKTLISRVSAVLVQNIEENKSNACILLETKISPFRQNFDYFQWKKFID